jgi:hypothetical protein
MGAAVQADGRYPAYGTHLRLKSSFNISVLPTSPARVIARALQQYGMLLASHTGGPALSASSSLALTEWTALGFSSSDLSAIDMADFEVVSEYNVSVPSAFASTVANVCNENCPKFLALAVVAISSSLSQTS